MDYPWNNLLTCVSMLRTKPDVEFRTCILGGSKCVPSFFVEYKTKMMEDVLFPIYSNYTH